MQRKKTMVKEKPLNYIAKFSDKDGCHIVVPVEGLGFTENVAKNMAKMFNEKIDFVTAEDK